MMMTKKVPMRKCILTKSQHDKRSLIRIVKTKEGELFVDSTGKKNGRGAYVVKDLEVVNEARQKQKFEQFFNSSVEALNPIYDEVIRLIYREDIPKK